MTGATTSPIGVELLDAPDCPDELVRATLRDITVANRVLGGRRAAAWGVSRLLRDVEPGRALTLLDVGAGGGDIARHIARLASRRGHLVSPVLLDRHRAAAAMSHATGCASLVADVWRLPFAPRSVDLVLASQFLHHFSPAAAREILGHLNQIARVGVVIADLRRARIAALGIWLASFCFGFHPVTRRDGVTSVRRGFTPAELSGLLLSAGIQGTVVRRPGYRVVAAWRVAHADG
jgi:SAM-dependent methyltransferase